MAKRSLFGMKRTKYQRNNVSDMENNDIKRYNALGGFRYKRPAANAIRIIAMCKIAHSHDLISRCSFCCCMASIHGNIACNFCINFKLGLLLIYLTSRPDTRFRQ